MLSYSRRFSLNDKDSPLLDDTIPQLAWSDEGSPGGGSNPAYVAWTDAGASEDSALVDFGPEAAKKATGGGKSSGGSTTPSGTGGTTSGGGTTTSGGGTTTSPTTGSSFTPITVFWNPLNPPSGDSTAPTDTLFPQQQYSLTRPEGSINVLKAWQNYTGLGIKVGIIDDGIDYKHSDLSAHYLYNLDYDTVGTDYDSYFGSSTDSHGTNVAGVIGAARNGTGVVGVAYNAGEAMYRIGYTATAPGSIPTAFTQARTYGGMDVINASWGYSTAFTDNFGGAPSYVRDAAVLGRNGLGIDVVFAGGNFRTSGDDVNYHNYKNNPFVIAVAATDASGVVESWSSPGAALLVSAPGDGVWTDDLSGTAGVSGDYTMVSGTSFAAPHVSGVIALMLQANPNLGYRDVMEILAYSARNSDPGSASWETNGAHDWNGGGLHFSQDYGFGLVDATAAVRLAESWQKQSTYADLSWETVARTDNLAIPDGSGSVSSVITLDSSLRLEKAVVDLNITHANASDLTVTLTSPSGTVATLVHHPQSGTGTGIVFEMTANNFWGEDAKGNWTLTVSDSVTGNKGTLNGWTLEALADAPNTPTTYVYTDEFATSAGDTRSVLHDTTGLAGINTAAITSGSWLDLNPGAVDTIAGRTVQIGTDTVLKTAWAGDGNDMIIANNAGDTIEAGRGNDTIVAGAGGDKLWGGPGNDVFVIKALAPVSDTIGDFSPGSDVIDLHQLIASIGYGGTNPVADGWLALTTDASGTGTNISVDAHNGQGLQDVVDVVGVAPMILKQGIDYLTTTAHV